MAWGGEKTRGENHGKRKTEKKCVRSTHRRTENQGGSLKREAETRMVGEKKKSSDLIHHWVVMYAEERRKGRGKRLDKRSTNGG